MPIPHLANQLISTTEGCGSTAVLLYEFTATDACGNTTITYSTFTIEDTTPPAITTPAGPTTIQCNGFSETVSFNTWLSSHGGAVASDLCGGTVAWSYLINGFATSCGDFGTTTVTFVATDECGNSAETTSTFTIEDNIPPIISCPDNIVLECGEPNNNAIISIWLSSATAFDSCDNIVLVSHDFAALDMSGCGMEGTTTVTFTAEDDCGNMAMCTATISIDDTTPPFISNPAVNQTLECNPASNATAFTNWLNTQGGAAAIDDCGDVTWTTMPVSPMIVPQCGDNVGEALVTFIATDACGNTSSTSAIFKIEDTTPPVITVPPDVTAACGSEDINGWIAMASAMDDCGNTHEIEALLFNTIPSCGGLSTMVYQFNVHDDCGNEAQGLASYTITDNVAPTIMCPADLELECGDNNNDQLILAWLNSANAVDACTSVEITTSFPGTLPDNCGGMIPVTFTATDACGNAAECIANIILDDTTDPVFPNCPGDITVNVDADLCTSNVVFSTPLATDNCGFSLVQTHGTIIGKPVSAGFNNNRVHRNG